jgi:small subunit ribosomal protein S4
MSRYTGSVFKKARRLGFSILENNKEFSKGKKRTTAPGQHGARKTKLKDYGMQLKEKQKIQFVYGLNERQLRNTFAKAKMVDGILGVNFLRMLESRLDNLVYRMGFAPTRRGSRQLVTHGHILVNGKKIDIASYQCSVGDEISVKEKSKKLPIVSTAQDVVSKFVEVNKNAKSGKFTRLPERDEINKDFNETQVVEWYNRLVK